MKKITEPKMKLFNDNFQNYKRYGILKTQLVIADIPYNIANNAFASSPEWYNDGDNSKGESNKANTTFLTLMLISELQSLCTFVRTC